MATLTHNAHVVALRLAGAPAAVEEELARELQEQAQLVARVMRSNAPKFMSVLTNSVHVEEISPLEVAVRPGTDYALYRETGTRPGKGLPRYEDPEAGDIIRWLESKAFAGQRRPKRGSARADQRERELRDRYEGLAWHVRHFGTKATPYVEPTAREMEQPVLAALRAAVDRGLARDGGMA